jgi:hypothetical protein
MIAKIIKKPDKEYLKYFDTCGNAFIQCQNCIHAMPTLNAGIIECGEKQESRAATGEFR